MSLDNTHAQIEAFVKLWPRGYRRDYEEIFKDDLRKVELALETQNIMHARFLRFKDHTSLRDKLYERAKNNGQDYKEDSDIIKDIYDLGGMRIALFNAKVDESKVEEIVTTIFDVYKTKRHRDREGDGMRTHVYTTTHKDQLLGQVSAPLKNGYQPRFGGYNAVHYLAHKKNPEEDAPAFTLEIQVTSILHHVWATVGHNIAYKEHGKPSESEKRLLDQLHGLLDAADVVMEHLQWKNTKRLKSEEAPFESKYHLGTWLRKYLRDAQDNSQSMNMPGDSGLWKKQPESKIGSMGALEWVLQHEQFQLMKPKDLKNKLDKMIDFPAAFLQAGKTSVEEQPLTRDVAVYISQRLVSEKQVALSGAAGKDQAANMDAMSKLQVIASAVIWLDEFFHYCGDLQRWVIEPSGNDMEAKVALRWLLRYTEPTILLEGRWDFSEEASKTVHKLWDWFASHRSPAVRFTFDLSQLGVVRKFPEEVDRLQDLGSLWCDYFN